MDRPKSPETAAFAAAKVMAQKKRILLVHTGMSYGGVDVYLANLIFLLKSKADLFVFCSSRHARHKLLDAGARDLWNHPLSITNRWLQLLLFFAYLPVARFHLGIETVWVQGGVGTFCLPFCRMLGFETIATRHSAMKVEELGSLRRIKHLLIESLVRRLLCCAHRVICVSNTVAEGVRLVLSPDKLSIIPNWVPEQPNNQKAFDSRAPLRLLFVGRLEKFKGAGIVITALRKLRGCGRDVVFTIVGDGHYRADLERQAVGTQTVFAGFHPDPSEFYRTTDIFINPTENPCEGMPLTSLEAMSFGLPCIFSDLAQNREIVGADDSALVFKIGDVDDLIAKLSLCHDETVLQSLGQRARSTINKRFSPAAAFTEYVQILNIT